ncbi:MAG: DUF4291 family protein, partial [Actinomadura sp.]
MTWIKPSFLWMMYRCGWGTKEGQETVLAIEVTRDGFEWALKHACLAHYEHELHLDRVTWKLQLKRAPARVQDSAAGSSTRSSTRSCSNAPHARCSVASLRSVA